MARRLFHAIVLVGTSMGAAQALGCASRDAPPSTDARTDALSDADDETPTDSFQMIMPMPLDTGSAPVDTGSAPVDSGKPPIDSSTVTDTKVADTTEPTD